MNISKREKALIIIVILLALFGAYYLYYLKPNMDNIHTLKAEIENKKIEAAANEQQKARVGQLNAQIADVNEQIALFGDSIAQAFDQPPILVYLSDTVGLYAQKASISFMQPEQVGEIERCTITIAMVSTYDGLKQVLAAFADAPYLLRVTGLSAAPPKAPDTTEDTGRGGRNRRGGRRGFRFVRANSRGYGYECGAA
jgi:Tfp pilus assembly protein PilO